MLTRPGILDPRPLSRSLRDIPSSSSSNGCDLEVGRVERSNPRSLHVGILLSEAKGRKTNGPCILPAPLRTKPRNWSLIIRGISAKLLQTHISNSIDFARRFWKGGAYGSSIYASMRSMMTCGYKAESKIRPRRKTRRVCERRSVVDGYDDMSCCWCLGEDCFDQGFNGLWEDDMTSESDVLVFVLDAVDVVYSVYEGSW